VLISAVLAFLVSLTFTFFLVPHVCSVAQKLHIMDVPDGNIKKHKQATPYLGGVAVYLGFTGTLFFFLPVESYLLFLLFGLTILLFLGLIDDLWQISPGQKWIGQMIAAASFLGAGFSLKESFLSSAANLILSFLWIMAVDNAFNLVDVMDGLATLLAISATLSFLVFAYFFKLSQIIILLSTFLGALVAFFYYNKPSAKIYLGDAGALFIGGFLAVVPFYFNWGYHGGEYGFLVPVIVLAVPLMEVTSLIVIRTYKGIPFYHGSPDHYCLYLQGKGWTVKEILLFSSFMSFVLFIFAYLVAFDVFPLSYIVLLSLVSLVLWHFLIFFPSFLKRTP
jgi:UDP-GlcNAc:undecaprenyl-phosphate/decaprenyl-phosphate GlcNAc-1-phosphate transferase